MKTKGLYNLALILAIFTIFYNLAEGIVSVAFGMQDESLALFGFGLDSFIEMISGFGIAHMIFRIRKNPESSRDKFENGALKITGYSFYLLTIGLVFGSLYTIYQGHNPESTMWGVVISIISIVIMLILLSGKNKCGKELKSDAILADAECTKVCIYMSLILLFSSFIYEYFNISNVDAIATLGLAYYSFKEGKECFEKIKNNSNCGCAHK